MVMNFKGLFIFKGCSHRAAGTFTDDKGVKKEYKESYVVSFDEKLDDGSLKERTIKFSCENKELYEKISKLTVYQKVIFVFAFNFTNYGYNITLVDIELPVDSKSTAKN